MADTERSWLLNALLPGSSDLFDLGIEDGSVAEVRRAEGGPPGRENAGGSNQDVDLSGVLLLPPLSENHAHLDKAKTADTVINRTGDLAGAIEAWIDAERSGRFHIEEMQRRVESTVVDLVHSGVQRLRTHVNIGASDPELRNLKAVRAVRERFAALVDIEIVALLHSPLTGPDSRGNRIALDKALELGVDLVGGCPHLEPEPEAMIDVVLESARTAGIGIDLHVDETLEPTMLTLVTLARRVVDTGFDHEVSASHCVSLSVQPLEVLESLASLVAEARIRVVALPQTNLFLQGWNHPVSTPRGIAPIALLADQGIEVAAGGDNVEDPFNPMGRSDPLETASLLVTAAHMPVEKAFESVSVCPLTSAEFRSSLVGSPADFLGIAASNVREAVARAPSERMTIRHGRVVARTFVERKMNPPSA